MEFIVLDRFGNIVFHTEHEECIPSKEEIKQIKEAGYKVKQTKERKRK